MSVSDFNIIKHVEFKAMLGRYTSRLLSKRYIVLVLMQCSFSYAKYEYNVYSLNEINKSEF